MRSRITSWNSSWPQSLVYGQVIPCVPGLETEFSEQRRTLDKLLHILHPSSH